MKLFTTSTKYLTHLVTLLLGITGLSGVSQAAIYEDFDLNNQKFAVMLPDNVRSYASATENRQLPTNIKGWTSDSVQVYVALVDKTKATQFFSNLLGATTSLGFFNPILKADENANRTVSLYSKYYQQPTAIGSLDFKLYGYFINEINATRPSTKITQSPLRNIIRGQESACEDDEDERKDSSAKRQVKVMTVSYGNTPVKVTCKKKRDREERDHDEEFEQYEKELSNLTRTFVGSRFYQKRDVDQDLFHFWLSSDKRDALVKDLLSIPVVRLMPFNDQVEFRLVKLNGKPAIRIDANVVNITREYRGNYQYIHALTQDYSPTQYLVGLYYYFNEQVESRNNILDAELFLQSLSKK